MATAGVCLGLLGLVILCWPREQTAALAADAATELASIARIAEDRPFLGLAISALIGAGKAIEQGRPRP